VIRRRGPFRIVLLLVLVGVVGGIFVFNIGPLAVRKQAYEQELYTIHQRMSNQHQTAVSAQEAFQKVVDPQDSDWEKMGESADRLSKQYDELVLKATGLEPPKDSRAAHERLLTTLRINSQIYSNVAKAARAHDRTRMRDAVIDGNRLTQDVSGETQETGPDSLGLGATKGRITLRP
jgi:hypothetical protein